MIRVMHTIGLNVFRDVGELGDLSPTLFNIFRDVIMKSDGLNMVLELYKFISCVFCVAHL